LCAALTDEQRVLCHKASLVGGTATWHFWWQPTATKCKNHKYSLSRIAIRPHAAQTTDTVACTLSAHSAHHAQIMFPFVFPWRAHHFLCILPVQLLTVCFLLSSGLHSNYHGNYITECIIVFVSPAWTCDTTQYYSICHLPAHNTTYSITIFVSPAWTYDTTQYYSICVTCLHKHNILYYNICHLHEHVTQHTVLQYLCHLPAHGMTHRKFHWYWLKIW
jgi:hypothetical protein